jgi:hypothetical protein
MFTLFTLTMSMLSGSLYRGPELWAALVLCFACKLPRSNRKQRLHRHAPVSAGAISPAPRDSASASNR